jgi:hypothetical protein
MPGHCERPVQLPMWLLPHFQANVDGMGDFHANPLPQGSTPRTVIIWASECVLDRVKNPKLPPGPEDTEDIKFLTERRTDYSAEGWAPLFPGDEIQAEVLHGAHHFSMMVSF